MVLHLHLFSGSWCGLLLATRTASTLHNAISHPVVPRLNLHVGMVPGVGRTGNGIETHQEVAPSQDPVLPVSVLEPCYPLRPKMLVYSI